MLLSKMTDKVMFSRVCSEKRLAPMKSRVMVPIRKSTKDMEIDRKRAVWGGGGVKGRL